MKQFTIGEDAADQRLDRYVKKLLPRAKSGEVQRWIRTKKIKVNKLKCAANQRLTLGDVVWIFLPDPVIDDYMRDFTPLTGGEGALKIVFENDDILIVDKPVGLLTHPDKTEYKNTLATQVQHYLKRHISATFRPASINRLDKNTSGLVLFGKNYAALKRYNQLMREGKIKKQYSAVAIGNLTEPVSLKAHIVKDARSNKVFIVDRPGDNSKRIHTDVEPIDWRAGFSKLRIHLHTGRTHQIRVSLAHLGYPIVGDVKYGGAKVKGVTTQLLHAESLIVDGVLYQSKSVRIEDFWEHLKD